MLREGNVREQGGGDAAEGAGGLAPTMPRFADGIGCGIGGRVGLLNSGSRRWGWSSGRNIAGGARNSRRGATRGAFFRMFLGERGGALGVVGFLRIFAGAQVILPVAAGPNVVDSHDRFKRVHQGLDHFFIESGGVAGHAISIVEQRSIAVRIYDRDILWTQTVDGAGHQLWNRQLRLFLQAAAASLEDDCGS